MKRNFIRTITGMPAGTDVVVLGWLKAKRNLGGVLFADISDSTGTIQIVAKQSEEESDLSGTETLIAIDQQVYKILKATPLESSVKIHGVLAEGRNSMEVQAHTVEIIGGVSKQLSPQPRSQFDVFDVRRADHLLRNRHFYIRNPKIAAILKFRHMLMRSMHNWFDSQDFIEMTAPVLTPLPLYDDDTALDLHVHDDHVYLTQCVGFYLESAVHSFERLYNMGPSFRGEEGRSKRHLMEYWHVKAEVAWVDREDLMRMVEELISYTTGAMETQAADLCQTLEVDLCLHGLQTPFPRITYTEAVERLKQLGFDFEFGKSLGSKEEAALSKQFVSPFWIVGLPRSVEPFPYVIDPNDDRLTMTADLIASGGYGELLGVAEKIHDLDELDERMKEKGKFGDERYNWLRDLRQYGSVPHGGFGMGLERYIRWLLDIPHVRDTMPFPRIFKRKIFP